MTKVENRRKLLPMLASFVAALSLICALLFFCMSIFSSYYLGTDNYLGVIEELRMDNVYLNILAIVIVCCLLYLFSSFYERINMKSLLLVLMLWTFITGFGFVYSASRIPAGDAEIVVNAAFQMAQGKRGVMLSYFDQYPFRLGLTLFYRFFFRLMLLIIPSISRSYCVIAMQVINVFFLMLSYYVLVKISSLLYRSDRVSKLTAVFLLFCLPANLSCTSLSGRLPAMMFSLLGILFFIRYYRENMLRDILLSVLFCSMAQLIKLDSVIILIAILLIALCGGISFRKPKAMGLALLLSLFALLSPYLPATVYKMRNSMEHDDNDLSVYSAMGFAEEEDVYLAYEELYSVVNHAVSHSIDAQKYDKKISWESLHRQWNEPSFRTLHNNRDSQHYRNTGTFYTLLCYKLNDFCITYMGLWQSLVLLGFALGNFFLLRKDYIKLLPSLCVVGGVLFHLIYQVESQHAMKYYLLMLPAAAYGFEELFKFQNKKGESL